MSATNRRQLSQLFRLYPISPISEMTDDYRTYHAYLLRLWRVNTDRRKVWHASLEDPHTGERRGFADLIELFAFLEERTNNADQLDVNDQREQL